jgi:hypothetical protein
METGDTVYFFPFVFSYGAQLLIIGLVQLSHTRGEWPVWKRLMQAVLLSWLMFTPFFFFSLAALTSGASHMRLGIAVAALLSMAVTAGLYLQSRRFLGSDETAMRRWYGQSFIVFVGSLLWWLPIAIWRG